MLRADSQAAILINELDNLCHFISALPPHPDYDDALEAAMKAKECLSKGRAAILRQEVATVPHF